MPIETSQNQIKKLTERIINFYSSVLDVNLIKEHKSDYHDYSAIENRKRVVSHILRERNAFLSTLRKQLDNYQCQICKLKMCAIYGDLGVGYAEAHHIVPLNKTYSHSKTRVDDLITVCANCHRILHRMAGKKSDIPKLINIVKNKKKSKNRGINDKNNQRLFLRSIFV